MRLLFAGIAIASLSACLQSPYASAQNFDDRWSIIPKAHAEPAPEEKEQKQVLLSIFRQGHYGRGRQTIPGLPNRSIKPSPEKRPSILIQKAKQLAGRSTIAMN